MINLNNLPTCFTTGAPELGSVTERYKFIPTVQFIEDMSKLGYELQAVQAPRSGLGMHAMAFINPNLPQNTAGLTYRLYATNSHNGTSCFTLDIQVLRQVCSNGLIRFTSEFSAKIKHIGYAASKVERAVNEVQAQLSAVQNEVERMQTSMPSEEKRIQFLLEASKLREAKPYRLADLQATRRFEDKAQDAWTVFNRVQESLIRGGYQTVKAVEQSPTGITLVPGNRAKEITNVRERLTVNKELWALAVKMAA